MFAGNHLFLAGILLPVWAGFSPAATAAPITPEHFAMAAEYSRNHGGIGIRIEQDGKVFEDYLQGFSASTPHRIYSGTKNFVAVTALIAEQEGLLDLSEPASKTLTEWQHDRRRTITLNQLLSQTSGLAPGADIIGSARDQMAAALEVPMIDPPGTRFHYGPVGYQAFGEILKRKLRARGRSVEGYMKDKLFDPLDIDIGSWTHDDAGNPLMHAGLALSAEEWAKFGQFILDNGHYNRKQLVSSKLFPLLFTGHRANPAYGLGFWLNRPESHPRVQKMVDLLPAIDGEQIYPDGPRDIYAAEGTSKQRLYIIPSLDLVIVRFGWASRFSDGDFLSRLITGHPHPDAHTH
jgi:CubicO group peptidase (beta-lactamase class C family)